MIGMKIAAAVMIVCLCRITWAQVVDLSRPYEVDEDTIALYHLDDVASGTIADAVPGGKPGVVEKGVMSTLGRFGDAMTCDGTAGWIDVQDLPSGARLKAITVEVWVKFYGNPGGDIICRNGQYMMRMNGVLTADFGIDGNWRPVTGTKPLPVNKWTHLAMTYDEATRKVSIYVDGELDVSAVPQGITEGKLSAGENRLRIGSRTWRAEGGIINGAMDEIRVSKVARQYEPLHPTVAKAIPANTNLVMNGGFESGMHGWMVSYEYNANLLWHIEKGNAPQGQRYLAATVPTRTIMSYPFRIERAKVVTVSATMKADRPVSGTLGLHNTGGGSGTPQPRASNTVQVGTEWGRVSSRFTIGADWPTDLVYVEVGAGQDAKIDIDAVSVVIGDKTDYSETEAESVGIVTEPPKQSTYMLNSGSRMPVEVVDPATQKRNLETDYTIVDWQGQTVKAGKLTGTKEDIAIPDGRVGWFDAKFTVKEDGKVLKETTRIYNVIEPMKGVGSVVDSPLGMNTHMEREPDEHLDCNLGMLSLCGVKWIRAWWGWGMAEKQPGQFDWTEYDRQLGAVNRAGMEIMPILLRYYRQYEQAWAGGMERRIEEFPYKVEQWGSFVKTTAAQYKGKVKAWEMWNEPSNSYPADKYAPLLKETYTRIKEADPGALVVGGGGVPPEYIRQLCELSCSKSMDIMSNHSYGQLGRPWKEMMILWQADEAIGEEFGCTKRVWHTEQGSQADGMGFLATGQTEEECAVNLSQGYLSAISTGVEKFFWFAAATSVRYGWAVFYESYIPRPRLIALNGLARVLKDRKITGRLDLGKGKVACVPMDGQEDERQVRAHPAAAVWNTSEMVKLQLPAGTDVTLLDMLANPLEGAKAGEIELKYGRPVFIVAKKGTLKDLTEVLAKAKVDDSIPVEVTAENVPQRALKLVNRGDRNVDLRVTVEGAGVTKTTMQFTDLEPDGILTMGYAPTKATTGEATVKVTLEAGGLEVRTETREVKVKF
jgi:hypothetical protein